MSEPVIPKAPQRRTVVAVVRVANKRDEETLDCGHRRIALPGMGRINAARRCWQCPGTTGAVANG